jgi:hypothetical protein
MATISRSTDTVLVVLMAMGIHGTQPRKATRSPADRCRLYFGMYQRCDNESSSVVLKGNWVRILAPVIQVIRELAQISCIIIGSSDSPLTVHFPRHSIKTTLLDSLSQATISRSTDTVLVVLMAMGIHGTQPFIIFMLHN